MGYEPRPVDTSRIALGPLDSLAEYLAEQTHEVWAKQRTEDGWTLGPQRDDAKKQTPDLVPYAALPESEKNYDRKISEHAVKLIIDRGYSIEPPPERVPRPTTDGGPAEQDLDDMVDDREIEWFEKRIAEGETALAPFIEMLQFFHKETNTVYRKTDKDAGFFQRWYLRISLWSTMCAGAAVVLAIYQLTKFPQPEHHLLSWLEMGLVILAVLMVLVSFHFELHERWLLCRLKAERLRELKFGALVDPRFWQAATRPEQVAAFRSEVHKLEGYGVKELPAHLFDPPRRPESGMYLTGNTKLDSAVVAYYLRRRLAKQVEYFEHKSHDYHRRDKRTRIFGVVLFFAVTVVVFAHGALAMADVKAGTPAANLEHGLIMAAALLPAIAAMFRVFRAGREAGRNYLRTEATYRRVIDLMHGLEATDLLPAQTKFMARSESALSAEQRQWLQLMQECEWYG